MPISLRYLWRTVCFNESVYVGDTMKRVYWVTVTVGMSCFAVRVYTYVHPQFLLLMLFLLLLSIMGVIILNYISSGFTALSELSRQWPLPVLVCVELILCVYIAPIVGRCVLDWRFERHIAEYSRVVNGIENGTVALIIP